MSSYKRDLIKEEKKKLDEHISQLLQQVNAQTFHKTIIGEINALSVKETPIDADIVIIEDSAASYAKKKALLNTLPAGAPGAHVLATTGPHTGTLPWTDLSKTGSSLGDLATRNHVDLANKNAEANVKHLTDAQLAALHTKYTNAEAVAAVAAADKYLKNDVADIAAEVITFTKGLIANDSIEIAAGKLVDGKDVSGLCTTAEAVAAVEAAGLDFGALTTPIITDNVAQYSTFGRCQIGVGGSAYAYFGYRGLETVAIAIRQNSNGQTVIQAADGQAIYFHRNAVEHMRIDTKVRIAVELAMQTNKITGLGDPVDAQDAATKAWVIALGTDLANYLAIQDLDMDGFNIVNLADPVNDQDAATKAFVMCGGASDDLIFSNDTERSKIAAAYTKIKEIQVGYNLNLRVYYEASDQSALTNGFTRVYLNGVAVGAENATTNDYTAYTHDMDVVRGDLIQIYGYITGGIFPCYVKNMRLKYITFISNDPQRGEIKIEELEARIKELERRE